MDEHRRERLIDVALCGAMLAYGLPPTLDPAVNDPAGTVAGAFLLPALFVPVFLRRRHPLAAAGAFAAGCALTALPTLNQFRLVVAVPVAVLVVFSLGFRAPRGRSAGGLALVLAGLLLVGATESVLSGAAGVAQMALFAFPICLAVWGVGRLSLSRERLAGQLAERSAQVRRQREVTAELAVEIDRARLAADLDAAVRARLEEMVRLARGPIAAPPEGPERFARIEGLGREALDRMRELLGVLRSPERATRAPRPTLEQLDSLLAGLRAGGRAVDLVLEGERRPLEAGLELAAFRTLQHALVAVAGEAERPARVALRYLPDGLELEVRGLRPDGVAAGAALAAARERVGALGGTLTTDTPAPGRRTIRARLPLVPAHA